VRALEFFQILRDPADRRVVLEDERRILV